MMTTYRRPADIAALVEDDRVHRDVYLSDEVFTLEQRHFFANTWNYVGHASQVPAAGDFITVEIAGRLLVTDACGNVGKFFRCPYHAWTYKLDGTPLAIPLKGSYEGTRLHDCESGRGMVALRHVEVYRDFVFARIGDAGIDFKSYFGDVLDAIDNLVDRSPVGRLRIEGGVLRNVIQCNWKMYLENINDTVHPQSTHESPAQAARALWQGQPDDAPKPMAMEQILPFGAGYDFFDRMGGRIYPNGHSVLGTRFSIHSGYARLPDYERTLADAYHMHCGSPRSR